MLSVALTDACWLLITVASYIRSGRYYPSYQLYKRSDVFAPEIRGLYVTTIVTSLQRR